MIKNIVFDIGDVLIEYSLENYAINENYPFNLLNEANNILIKETRWRKYINGRIKINEFTEYLVEKFPQYEKEFNIILKEEYQNKIMSEIRENTDIIKRLKKKGYMVYLLSNIAKETIETIKKEYDFVEYVDGAIYSCDVNVSKPDKEIYLKLLSKYSLEPNQTLFIDDKEKNIEMANNFNIQGIVYKNGVNLEEEISKKLGEKI